MNTKSDFGARKIFLMLFLMIGSIKILVPFVEITRGADRAFRRTLARRAILFSAAALALAGVLGRSMLENFEISLPVLALTGGLVLFLVALRTVLQLSAGTPASASLAAQPPSEISLRAARLPDDRHPLRDRGRDRLCNLGWRQGRRGVHSGRHRIDHTGPRLGGDAVCRADPPTNRDRASGVCRRARRHADRSRPAGDSAEPVHDRGPCRMQEQASVMQIRHLHPRFDALITQGCANEVRQQACTFCDNAKGRILRSSGCDGIVEGARACSD